MTDREIRVWNSRALDRLLPLRWHLNELIWAMEEYNSYAVKVDAPLLSKEKIKSAKKALDKAERFFSNKK